MTQLELAKLAGVGREAVYRIENGRKPSSRVLFAIAKALGHDIDRIFSGWPEPADPEGPCYGARIRYRRRQRGLTLQDLAAATGLKVATLSRLECEQAAPKSVVEVTFDSRGEQHWRVIHNGLANALGFDDADALDDYCTDARLQS